MSTLPLEGPVVEETGPDALDVDPDPEGGALTAFRRIVGAMPELRHGLAVTLVLALAMAAGRVVVPILLQQVIDRGLLGPDG
ncbi:MAG: ABC transporter ATP-binding protein, partial [Acidimicrobiales bacterium]|nr:ABC transporter ATP-binding protein [Acidimicrobiales bacterium]